MTLEITYLHTAYFDALLTHGKETELQYVLVKSLIHSVVNIKSTYYTN